MQCPDEGRVYFCCLCEWDMGNGCTECGICSNRMASRCMDEGCEVDCCCEQASCRCCEGTCTVM